MRLAKQVGEADLDELKERITHRQLVDWVAFWELEREAEERSIEEARSKK